MLKILIFTQGCSANVADSEAMAGLLQEAGHILVGDEDDADIVIFNTCTVKGPTESFFRKKMAELRRKKKKVIIAGCIPQSEKVLKGLEELPKIGTFQISRIIDAVNAVMQDKEFAALERGTASPLLLPRIRKNSLVEIVPISQGCTGCCTFCKTKQARGALHSYPEAEILQRVRKAVKEKVREFWITSQDNSVYGKDLGSAHATGRPLLAELLKKIIAVPGEFKVRLGMANPGDFMIMLDDIIELFKSPKMFKFIHVPVQSGSDSVLRAMRRNHSAEDFIKIAEKFRKRIPDITIMTDMICGFPGESANDFDESMMLLRKARPDLVNVSRFWARPGTPAARMKQLSGGVIKERGKQLMDEFKKIAAGNNKAWIGRKTVVFFSEQGKNGTIISKNRSYK